jgi:hypothetical protein
MSNDEHALQWFRAQSDSEGNVTSGLGKSWRFFPAAHR